MMKAMLKLKETLCLPEPENEAVLCRLNEIYREVNFDCVVPEAVAKELGFEVIPDILRRFNESDGNYTV